MPARSISQQRAFGAALAAKRGQIPASSLQGVSKTIFNSASTGEIRKFAGTKLRGLPSSVKALNSMRKKRKAV